VTVAFAKDSSGPWDVYVSDARNYRFARVTTEVPVPLTFFMAPSSAPGTTKLPIGLFLLGEKSTMAVAADSMAGQMMNDTYKEGLFPFSPFAHNNVAPHFGLDLGEQYTLRWASTPRLTGGNTCDGDRSQAMINLAEAGGGEERGFIEETSAEVIRNAIVYDYQTITRTIGDRVCMTGGAKQTILDALLTRIDQDPDTTSQSFADYIRNQRGNGRRLIGAPVNTGYPDYKIVQIGAFFLLNSQEYNQGGNKPFCAEYVGAWLQGAKSRAASDAGSFIARLIR
jgi:hypothetical protein